MALNTEV